MEELERLRPAAREQLLISFGRSEATRLGRFRIVRGASVQVLFDDEEAERRQATALAGSAEWEGNILRHRCWNNGKCAKSATHDRWSRNDVTSEIGESCA